MAKVILVRHGMYDTDGHLTRAGIEQVESLARVLQSLLSGSLADVAVYAGESLRTQETARFLRFNLNITFIETVTNVHLGNAVGAMTEATEVVSLIQHDQRRVTTIVLVTHAHVIDEVLNLYLPTLDLSYTTVLVDYGHAVVIDTDTPTYTFI